MRVLRLPSLLVLTLLLPLAAQAQKKVLTQSDWDRWRSIQAPTLSNDGKWVAYTLSPQVGDGEFVVRETSGSTEYRLGVGYISRPNNTPGGLRGSPGGGAPSAGAGGGRGGGGAGGPFTYDSKYAFVITQPTKAEVEKAARASRAGRGAGAVPVAEAPAATADTTTRNALVMITLADGKQTQIDNATSFRAPCWRRCCSRR